MKRLHAKQKNFRVGAMLAAGVLGLAMVFFFLQNAQAMGLHQEEPEDPHMPEAVLASLEVITLVDTPRDDNLVRPGGQLTFTVRYTNTTGSSISNVVISDTLGKGQAYSGSYSASDPSAQYQQNGPLAMQWTIPTLPANASGSIVFYTTVYTTPEPIATKSPIFIGNAVKVFSTQSGITGGQDDAVAVVCGPLLELTKVVGPTQVLPGHVLAYTITVANIARQDSIEATNLVVTDTLPTNTTYFDAGQGGQYIPDANAVVWHLSEPLYPGEKILLNFRVYVAINISANTISNGNSAYRARSSEIKLADVIGKVTANATVRALLEKKAFAKTMVNNMPNVFPTEEVTYTITIYNPVNEELHNVALTDTLPGNPIPFTYLRPANGDPAPTILNAGRDLAWTISSLPAWGTATRSFVVQIPRKTFINDNQLYTDYPNTLNAYHPQAAYKKVINLATVRVKAAMVMEKIVSNSTTQPGVTIFYTITLKNVGPFLIDGIRLTDTIQSGSRSSHYLYMTDGPNPLPAFAVNPIVWEDAYLSVPSGTNLQISFAAFADGDWLKTYCNGLKAISPDAYIPSRTNIACFFLDSPMKINKTVTPSSIYPGGEVEYEITLFNTSLVNETFTLDRIEDTLPPGFYQVGGSNGNPALIPVDPDHPIAPEEEWTGSFIARVTTDVGCNNLPKVYWNETGKIRQYYTTPEIFYAYNAGNLAPLTVNPHVLVDLLPYRRVTPPGSVVSYTLSLNNQSPTTLTGVNLVITLPTDQYYTPAYIETLPGSTPPSSVNGQVLTWNGLTLPANNETIIIFTVQIPGAPVTPVPPPTRNLTPQWNATAGNGCVGKLDTGLKPNGTGVIVVDPFPVVLSKTAISDWVPPDSLVEYTINISNKDAYPFNIDTITDIMPDGFSFVSMIQGPTPEVNETTRQLIWRNVPLQAGGNAWRLQLRAATLYGEYYNTLTASDNEVIIQPFTAKPVSVVPSVSIIKRVGVEQANPGSIIPYTITLVNLSEVVYSQIRITDTLPTGFTYVQMAAGYPIPAFLGPNSTQPVWTGLNLPANCGPNGCKVELVFMVRVGVGVPTGTYYNLVAASSNSGSIPNLGKTAPVFVTDQPYVGEIPNYLPLIIR